MENAKDFFDQYFIYGIRIYSNGDSISPDGRISRINLRHIDSFDLFPDGTVYAWMNSGDGYEVRSTWLIDAIKHTGGMI